MRNNWDTQTAAKCRLPELLPDICDTCRDKLFCHRQLTINDLLEAKNMSSYDEDGKPVGGVEWVISHGMNGTECELCGEPISRVKDGKLYDYDGELFCFNCLFNEIFGKYKSMGYCDNCTAGFSEADKEASFVKHAIYPVGGKALCTECIIESKLIDRIIDEDDPLEE